MITEHFYTTDSAASCGLLRCCYCNGYIPDFWPPGGTNVTVRPSSFRVVRPCPDRGLYKPHMSDEYIYHIAGVGSHYLNAKFRSIYKKRGQAQI